jgi:hypothetical protein
MVWRVTGLNVDHSSPVQTRFNSWIIGFIPSNSSNREVAPFGHEELATPRSSAPPYGAGACVEQGVEDAMVIVYLYARLPRERPGNPCNAQAK